MQLTEVKTPADEKTFIEVNARINERVANYIRPLDNDVSSVFDPSKNKTFRSGSAIRWILRDGSGRLIGRIAAFINKKYKNKGDEVPVGGIGFFDCINDQPAADLLFNTAKEWLISQGMEAMDGPINFGERDKWWGLVVEGFQSPLYGMNYNQPYYQTLFESYGFQPFYHQICFGMDPKKPFPEKMWARRNQVAEDKSFRLACIDKNELEKYATDFTTVYNKAWAGHGGMKQLKKEQVMAMFREMKPVMDVRMIWFVYHGNEPVAMFVNLPDLNQWFKHLDGKFDLLHKLKFLWVKKFRKNERFTGIVFGIIPEYQGMGVDAFMIIEASKIVAREDFRYYQYEMQWIGDFNPKMINVALGMGDVFESRRLTTYRYLFDRTRPFHRHPILS